MPTAASVGTTTFREVSVEPVVNRSGADTLTVILKGRSTDLATTSANWRRGATYPGYPTMYLETKSYVDRGPVSEITLNFLGLIDSVSLGDTISDIESAISRQSVSLTTSTDETVDFQYYAQSQTTRYIVYSQLAPTFPRYPKQAPTQIPVNQLFAPNPPKYTGTITNRYRPVSRLSQFTRTRVAKGVWVVSETWEDMIEAVSI